ncbi:hypothetical protein ACWCQE_17225, partial [Streptomyces sp. NPDC002409]
YEGHGGTSVPAGTFSPSSYRAWLSQWAVGFVDVAAVMRGAGCPGRARGTGTAGPVGPLL